jgi:type I restriction enzyme S subunit
MIEGLKPYPKMKDSGVPWLGRVPEPWETERAKWLFRKVSRPVRDTDEVITCFRDGTVTLRRNRRTRGFTEALKEIGYQGIRKGDLVIHAMDAFAGAVGVADSDGKGTPVYSVCEPKSTADSHYFAYAVREMARSQWIQALARGIRERSSDFRFDGFGAQPVPLPPLLEQTAIVRFLAHADRRIRRLIRSKQKLITLLEEQKQAIVHRAVTRGLDPNADLKPSGIEAIGDVPAHWATPLNQRVFRELIRPHEGRPEVQLSLSQRDGLIATENMKERSLQTSSFDNWKVVYPGDLVLNRFKAHLGVFFASTLRGIVSFHYGVFAARKPLVAKYFELLYHTRPYRAIYGGRSNGMTVGLQNLSNQNFYNVRTLVPPIPEQEAIVSYATSATETLVQAQNGAQCEIDLLKEFRTRLISDVVTGKLDVREAAARLPADDLEGDDPLDDTETDGEEEDDSSVESGVESGDGG